MLKIVKSGFSTSFSEDIFREIAPLAEKGVRSYLIVPEQQTVVTESLASRLLPPSSALYFEVTNFTRFANGVFRSLGGLSGEYCNSAKKSLLLWRALTELSPVLSMTAGRREISAGLVENTLVAIKELRSLGITAAMLDDTLANEDVKKDKRLSDKLSDIAKIYLLYKSLLNERYNDTEDDADEVAKRLLECEDFLRGAYIYVDGFTSFTESQYRLIAILAERCRVTLHLTLPKAREDEFEYGEVRECAHRAAVAARKRGAQIKLVRDEGYGKKSPESLGKICDLLWSEYSGYDNINLQNDGELRVFEAKTPYDECDFLCADIKRRVMEGASYSDFAIVARHADRYSGILDFSLSKAGIPAFTSHRRDINEYEAIKLIYSAYSAVSGFTREDVITYAKCSMSGVSREECDEFEMYVNKWQISGSRFIDGEVWNMNPLGYTTQRPGGTDEKLMRIHTTREKLLSPLITLSEKMKNARTVREHAGVLLDFILSIDLEAALDKRADMLTELGEVRLAEDNRALWGAICDALDTLVEVQGDLRADADSFLAQLKIVFATTDIGAIPAYSDEVTVGSADMLRLHEKPHIYLIGVNDGEFPETVSDSSYFSEHDKGVLASAGLAISPELEIRGARELYIFSRAFSYATESVTLSYSLCNSVFRSIRRSAVIDRICELTAGEAKPIKISELSVGERLYSAERALEECGEMGDDYAAVRAALINSGYEREVLVGEGDITNSSLKLGDVVLTAQRAKPLALTQTRIDSYMSCPLLYFCRYTLGLSDDERAEFDASNIGSFIHAILENFFRAIGDEGRSSAELTREEKEKLTRLAAEKYTAELGDAIGSNMTRIKIERLTRIALPVVEGLCEEFSSSSFEPRFFELAITRADDGAPQPVSFKTEDGRDIFIYGVIDRVDTYKKGDDVYLRVVDYKTGHKDFSPTDMAEGANLQMFLYLKSLLDTESEKFRASVDVSEGGRLIPAGVIYVKTAVGDACIDSPDDEAATIAIKEAQEREGMILDDEEVISAMNIKYTPLYSSKTPDKISEQKRKYLYTMDGWQEIMDTVEGAVLGVAERMGGGDISATPKHAKDGKAVCSFCEFKAICRKVEK